MKHPTNVKELETFLGMLTYLERFLSNLSQKTDNLRKLFRKNSEWIWDSNSQKAFTDLKRVLTAAPVLQYFDSNKQITLSVDASQSGLGAVLLQDNLPVEYASRSINETQKNYA